MVAVSAFMDDIIPEGNGYDFEPDTPETEELQELRPEHISTMDYETRYRILQLRRYLSPLIC